MKCRLLVPTTTTFTFLMVKNQERALSLLLTSNILDKRWLMMLPPRSPEKHPESQRVSIPMYPERNPNTSVTSFLILVPPRNEKEADTKKKNEKANEISTMDQHKIPLEELLYRFGSNLQTGLTTEMAIKRNLQEGDNKLPQKEKTPAWIRFLKEITNWFAIMLWIGSILSIITYILQPEGNLPNLYLAFVLMFVVVLTGIITFAQGAKSQALM